MNIYFQTFYSGFYSFLIIGRAVTVHCFSVTSDLQSDDGMEYKDLRSGKEKKQ